MNYSFLETASEQEANKFLRYINDLLYRVRKFNWLPHMRPLWIVAKKKAEARIEEIKFKNQ